MVHAVLSAEPISVDQAIAAVESDTAGAVVSFSGVVRNHDGGKPVQRLSYSAHPTAHQVMADVVAQLVAEQAAGRRRRRGRSPDDAAGGAGAQRRSRCGSGRPTGSACWRSAIPPWSAPSRPRTAARPSRLSELVDRIKAQVPIWKEQFFADGTVEWVGAGE